jgi:hypothetical protein
VQCFVECRTGHERRPVAGQHQDNLSTVSCTSTTNSADRPREACRRPTPTWETNRRDQHKDFLNFLLNAHVNRTQLRR